MTPADLRFLAEHPRDYPEDTEALLAAARTIERQRDLLELVAVEWTAAAKLNQITPALHDAMGEVVAYLQSLTETNGEILE